MEVLEVGSFSTVERGERSRLPVVLRQGRPAVALFYAAAALLCLCSTASMAKTRSSSS